MFYLTYSFDLAQGLDGPVAAASAPHPGLAAARSGDVGAAAQVVADTLAGTLVDALAALAGDQRPLLASVYTLTAAGLDVLPEVMAQGLHLLLGWDTDAELVQANVPERGGAMAVFAGDVEAGRAYVLVDNFSCGALAALRDYVGAAGGRVVAAIVPGGPATNPDAPPPRLAVHGEPGLAAVVVADVAGSPPRALDVDEIDRLRATKRMVADRASAIFMLRPTIPAPEHAARGKP